MGTSILTITNVTLVEQGDYHCLVNDWKKQDGGWWTSTRSRSGYVTGNEDKALWSNFLADNKRLASCWGLSHATCVFLCV